MKLKSLSRFLLVFLIGMLAATAACLILFTTWIQQSATKAVFQIEGIRAAYELQIRLRDFEKASALHQQSMTPSLPENKEALSKWITLVKLHVDDEEERKLINQIDPVVAFYLQQTPPQSAEFEEAAALKQALKASFKLADINVQQARALQQRAVGDDNIANFLGTIILIICCVIAPIIWIAFTRLIFDPLDRLHKCLVTFDEEDLRGIAPEGGVDEIRQIGSAFNGLTKRLLNLKQTHFRFLASVAHDLRNPLSAIRLSTHLMAEDTSANRRRAPELKVIDRQVDNLIRLVNDLLETSHKTGLKLERRKHNLYEVMLDAITLYRSTSRDHQIIFATQTDVEFDFDPARMGQVFNNLISNAIKYSPGGGPIDITMKVENDTVLIEIGDEGIGISEFDKHRIFEPFERAREVQESFTGKGLGLSVVRHIVEQHGGTIAVRDKATRGTIFSVHLPLIRSLTSALFPSSQLSL